MPKNVPVITLLLAVTVAFCSCNKGTMYKKYTTIPDNIWDMKAPVTFTVPVNDTTSFYNIFINVRNADNYAFSNLYLFIDITSPMHTAQRDTFECVLADPNTGKWRGEGLGDIWDNKIYFKTVRFPRSGDYNFTYTQAMRIDKLPMIMDVGLSIEKAEQKPANTN